MIGLSSAGLHRWGGLVSIVVVLCRRVRHMSPGSRKLDVLKKGQASDLDPITLTQGEEPLLAIRRWQPLLFPDALPSAPTIARPHVASIDRLVPWAFRPGVSPNVI